MKMHLVLAGLAVMLTATAAFAQEVEAPLKRFNARVAPVSLLLGELDMNFDVGVGDSWTLGPELALFNRNYGGVQVTGGALGVRANIYLTGKRYADGWLVGPFFEAMSLKLNESPYNQISISGSTVGTAFAYQWVWPGGFNMDAGAILGVYSFPGNYTLTDNNGNQVQVNAPYTGGYVGLEFTLGYAF